MWASLIFWSPFAIRKFSKQAMLFLAHWLVLIVLWFYVLQLARKDGPKLPACIAALWLFGYFAFPQLGIEGDLYFISYGAMLALVLIYVDISREKMGYRISRTDPLTDQLGNTQNEED